MFQGLILTKNKKRGCLGLRFFQWFPIALFLLFPSVGFSQTEVYPVPTNGSKELKRVLTLQDCLQLAAQNNPEIQISQLTEEMASRDSKMATGAFLPTIVGGASYWFVDDTALLPVLPGSLLFTNVGRRNNALLGASVLQPIYDQSLIATKKAANRKHDVAKYQKEMAEDRALGGVKKAFYRALFLKKIADLQKDYRNTTSRELEVIEKKKSRGTASELEVVQARGAEASTRSGYQQTLDNLEQAKDYLKRLIGYPLETEIILEGDLDQMVEERDDKTAEAGSVEGESPAIKMANAQYKLASAEVGRKMADFLPSLHGFFNLYVTNPNFLIEPNNDFNLHYWTGGTLKVPIFDGLRNVQAYKKAKAQEKIALIIKNEAYRQEKMKERAQARHPAKVSDTLEGPRKTYEAAKKSYEVARVAHQNRLISYDRWVDAQQRWARAQVDWAQAQLHYLDEQVERGQFESYLP